MASKTTFKEPVFLVRFWGVRGSYPTSDEATLGYGGHTSCVEVQAGGQRLIFDAGTGIIPLGNRLGNGRPGPQTLNLFLSHTHHDHVFGFYFFQPLFREGARVCIFGPASSGQSLKETLDAAMEPRFFPVPLRDLTAHKKIYSLRGGERIELRDGRDSAVVDQRSVSPSGDHVSVLVHKSSAHPNGVLLYRVHWRDKSMVYATDVEQNRQGHPDIIDFIRGADLLIHDAQYLNKEYFSRASPRKGWGHSTVEQAAEVARKASVKRLVLFHHEPTHDDRTLKQMEKLGRRLFPPSLVAYEGLEINLFDGR
ncbi:MAG TPA: MBL fold metallo-hydrolase [Candidatus Binatia bacterium]|nr:MBL fold metallo-hydrolase [Candidatus Binatia bacterium]